MGCSESYHKWLGTMNPSDLPIMKFHDKARRAELAICGNLRALRIYIALCGVWVCVYTGGRHDKKHIKTSISHPDWKSSAFFQRLRYHRQHLQVNAPAFQRLPALKLRDIDLKPFVHNLGGGIIERLTLWILSPRETLENPISIVHCPILQKKNISFPFSHHTTKTSHAYHLREISWNWGIASKRGSLLSWSLIWKRGGRNYCTGLFHLPRPVLFRAGSEVLRFARFGRWSVGGLFGKVMTYHDFVSLQTYQVLWRR